MTRFRERTAARRAAVQALYQQEQTCSTASSVVDEFLSYRLPRQKEVVDTELFRLIVLGAIANQETLDVTLESCLNESWTLARLDAVLRAILRAAGYELFQELATPVPIIINDYITITKNFFEEREPAFINGALDKAASLLRSKTE